MIRSDSLLEKEENFAVAGPRDETVMSNDELLFSTNLIQNSKNKIFGNEIPCILDFSHFEPVEA